MTDHATPATQPARTIPVPRLITHAAMQQLIDTAKASPLSNQERHRIFVRYGTTWWIRGNHGYCEITGPEENRKLDTWRRRLTEGPLWI